MTKEIDKTIGLRIRELRSEAGMTQEELAHRLGYKSKTTINKIEMGERSLTQTKIKQIADILRVSPMYIMGWEQPYKNTDSTFDNMEATQEGYYTDPETAKIAQEIFDDVNLRTLFHVARNASPEQLKLAKEMLEMMKKNEENR